MHKSSFQALLTSPSGFHLFQQFYRRSERTCMEKKKFRTLVPHCLPLKSLKCVICISCNLFLLLHYKLCNTWLVNNTRCWCHTLSNWVYSSVRLLRMFIVAMHSAIWSPDAPALLIRMCRAFSSSTMPLANSLTEARDDTSTRRRWTSVFPVFSRISLRTFEPRASFRQAKMTRAPRRARSRAMNLPIPERELVLSF